MLRAELIKSDTATAVGIKVVSSSPVIGLCRKLIESGHDPATPLEAYRGNTLALRIRSIGEAAGLEISSKGNGFVCAVRTAARARYSNIVGTRAADKSRPQIGQQP